MNYDKIKRTGILFLLGIGAITSLSCNDNDNANYPERVPTRLSVMPLPERVDYKESVVSLPQNVTVSQNIPASTSQLLKSTLEEKLSLSVSDASNDRAFIRVKQEADLAKEAYRLTVTKEGACVYYSTETGLLWGIQTLRQALEQANFFTSGSAKYLPMVDIKDAPKYDWRGFHIDVVRHMFTVDYLKKVIDCLSFYKINKLHLHLTDDQGWRIEIKKYPRLTEIGSKRTCTQVDGWHTSHMVNEPHEGFYTQEDIREIVAYANARGIMVVPEIDMPAHFAAAQAAYPWLACRELEREVPGYFGGRVPTLHGIRDWNRSACLGKESTFQFIFDVIDEVCELFDAPYFHIGGDEAPKDEWKKCPHCQAKMKEMHLNDVEELQGWFNNRVLEYVKQKGKRLIGWNEILAAGNLDPSVIGQYWTPKRDKNVERHIARGGDVILSNHRSFYFDMTYGQYPLSYTYDFDPGRYHILPRSYDHVLGVEAEVWTEWIDKRPKLDLNVYPRMQALAEVAWSAEERKKYADFKERLEAFKPTLDALGIGYAVTSVAEPGTFQRQKPRRLFYCGDTHYELKLNEERKAKGEK